MVDPIVMVLTAMLIGQTVLSVPMLMVNKKTRVYRLPLVLFLTACGVLALNVIVPHLFPSWYQAYTVIGFPMLFVLCPALRWYIAGLTEQRQEAFSKADLNAFILLWPAMALSVAIGVLPPAQHSALFVSDEDPSGLYSSILAGTMLVLMCLWLIECGVTLAVIMKRLLAFKRQLKNHYSNLDDRRLYTTRRLVFAAICIWIFALFSVSISNLLGQALLTLRAEVFTALILIWCVTFFAMQHTPMLPVGLAREKTEQVVQGPDAIKHKTTPDKYIKSALSGEQSARIVDKITRVMRDKKLYMDANLTLKKLADATGVSPNYLSQTLNETLGVNFFDFVNQWRIEASKSELLTSADPVLKIALDAGFNARSSFYKAFKKETGVTPGEFRKKHARQTCE